MGIVLIKQINQKMQSVRSSSSSSSSSFKSIQPPAATNYIEGKSCQLRFSINGSCRNELSIRWNLKNVKPAELHFSKHLLLIDLIESNQSKISEMANAFYKFMKLGDMLKVIDIRRMLETQWIEKTNRDFQWEDRKKSPKELARVVKKIMVRSEKYGEHLSIAVILSGDIQFAKILCKNLTEFISATRQNVKLNLFIQESFHNRQLIDMQLNCSKYYFSSHRSLLQSTFRQFFMQFLRLRARSVTIELQCLNSQPSSQKHQCSKWTSNEHTLTRRLTNLNNYTEYVEHLQLCSSYLTTADFNIKFRVQLMDGQIFEMEQYLTVKLEEKSFKSETPQTKNKAKPTMTYAGSQESYVNMGMHSEQILLRKSLGVAPV